jgi:fatty acid desaturase
MRIWKYSSRDGVPLVVTAAQLSLNIWLAATWSERTVPQLLFLWPISLMMFWYNPIVATHNFLHTPWFVSETANRVYAALNSINLGLPQILYRFHHMNHHRYENDRCGEAGRTRDYSSTYAYGKNGEHENIATYCALGLFRRGTAEAYREAMRKGYWKQFRFELAVSVFGLAGYLILSWHYVVFFHLPTFYVGWCLAQLENYHEHFGASPENREANSVSYYGQLYNVLFCNEGYHQEHHLRPQLHWTRRPQVRQTLGGTARVISGFPPLLGFLDRRRG